MKCPHCNEINSVDIKHMLKKGEFVDDDRNQTTPRKLGENPLEYPVYFKEINCKCGWSYFLDISVKKKI